MGAAFHRGKSKQDVGTPPELVRAVEIVTGLPIVVDLAADASNAVAPWYLDEEIDSLQSPWHRLVRRRKRPAVLWLNPPYAHIIPWARKCAEESALGARIALLVPASVGSQWFQRYVFGHAMVLLLSTRITFVGEEDPYPKDCLVAIYNRPMAGMVAWDWTKAAA